MNNIERIKQHPVYQQVLKDSFGGVMYNVANQSKYDAAEVLKLWDEADANEKHAVGGIMEGAMLFLKGDE